MPGGIDTGFRASLDIAAICPLYEGVIKAEQQKRITGIQCACICDNFGFDVKTIIRLKNFDEMRDLKELFCDDMYQACPYYKAWLENHKEAD